MRKLCLLALPLLIGAEMCASCSSQISGLESNSRSASIRVVVAPGGDDVLRSTISISR
jgi:hypothetical protein